MLLTLALTGLLVLVMPAALAAVPDNVADYFPGGMMAPAHDQDGRFRRAYGRALASCGDDPLYTSPADFKFDAVYRLVALRWLGESVIVRVEKHGAVIRVRSSGLAEGRGGAGTIACTASRIRILSATEATAFEAAIAAAHFWELRSWSKLQQPRPLPPGILFGVLDGDEFVIEGRLPDEYHVVVRHSSDVEQTLLRPVLDLMLGLIGQSLDNGKAEKPVPWLAPQPPLMPWERRPR